MTDIIEKVREAFEAERLAGKKVTSADEVPGTYEAITAEWLTDVLCGQSPCAKVIQFHLDAADDGASSRRRIFIEYNAAGTDANFPTTVFCKAAAGLAVRTTLAASGCSEAEVNFYQCALPGLDIPTPKPIYTRFDPQSFAYLVMMEDMSGEAFFPTETHVTTRSQAEAMVETLAKLHSRFYERPELGTPTLPFTRWDKWWKTMVTASPRYGEFCDQAFVESEHIMPARLFQRRDEVWSRTMQSAELHATLPTTLLHSDVHLKNWFILPGDTMGLHDWQLATCGHWSRDFAYTFAVALSIENRRAWEEDLLKLYLNRMSYYGVPRIDFESARTLYRQQLMTALAFWTITLRPAPEMSDMQPESTSWAFLKRLYAAVDDSESLDSFD